MSDARGPAPQAVDVELVRLLRAPLLRPQQPPQSVCFAGDDAPDTLHVAVLERGAPVAVASVMRDAYPADPGPRDWRVRGMATLPRARGRGLASRLLSRCEAHARECGGRRLWCNARPAARGLYERAGLRVVGEQFELAEIGPHYLMCKPLA